MKEFRAHLPKHTQQIFTTSEGLQVFRLEKLCEAYELQLCLFHHNVLIGSHSKKSINARNTWSNCTLPEQ